MKQPPNRKGRNPLLSRRGVKSVLPGSSVKPLLPARGVKSVLPGSSVKPLLPAHRGIENGVKLPRGEGAEQSEADEGKLRSRLLRKNATLAERRLWFYLRDRRFAKHKFVRQCSIGPYFVDFVCRSKKLIIEVDGSQHIDNKYDEKRTAYLSSCGYKVIRFWNNVIFTEPDFVLTGIADALEL